jgi:hypothetical protein
MFKLFIWLAVLNFLDGVATYFGYVGNIIQEVNPIMNELIVKRPLNFLIVKVIVSVLLLGLSFTTHKTEHMRILRSTMKISISAYGVVTLFHVVWIALFVYTI